MQIGFEAKRFFTNYTGLGNYARFVVDALSRYVPSDNYILYSPKIVSNPEVDFITARPNVSTIGPSGGYKSLKGVWRSWGVARDKSMKQLDVYHGLSQELPFGLPEHIKKVVTVHDLIYIRFPQFYNPIDVAIYKAKVKAACRLADRVIAISQQTAQDLIEFVNVDPAKIEVVYQGCHPIFKQKTSTEERLKVKARYSLPDQYILSVGTIEERKNVKLLVQALALLPESSRMPVVIVGRPTDYKNEVVHFAEEHNVLNKIIFLHNAAFQDLPAIYQNAQVFVYPSLFEGFGIPLVEAIESGVPVITSTGSCFREAAGPAAVYVDPQREDELAHQLKTLLEDAPRREKMVIESLQYIQRFQPPVIAEDLHRIYAQLTA